jgi:hypothetical protein
MNAKTNPFEKCPFVKEHGECQFSILNVYFFKKNSLKIVSNFLHKSTHLFPEITIFVENILTK